MRYTNLRKLLTYLL